ncbi:MAG: hypothetical protein E7547_02915 [Ruminococcaceae bacterium]|nr:hypothetical protein [Oscillospiraceae bacterium]
MRTFRIDFTQDRPCLDGCFMGRIGEHNATEVVITPPEVLAENEAVTNYVIAFSTGGMVIHSESLEKAETVSVPLWQQLTKHPVIGIQLEAYDDAGEFIGKSEYISGLRFLPSADGNCVPSDTDNPDFISLYLKTKHFHENKETLDKFSEDESGNLLYDKKPIEGGGSGAGLTDEQAAEIAANTEARHTHDNKDLLDKLKKAQYAGTQRYVFDEGNGKFYALATPSDIPPALSTDWVSNILANPDVQGSVSESAHVSTAGLRLISEKIAKVNEAISAQTHWRFELVEALPETGAENVIYLVPNSSEGSNVYDEYIFVNEAFEIIGSTAIDLTDYAKTEDIPTKTSQLTNDSGFITSDYINVKDYGAVGDGVTDDTAAIKAAVKAVPENGTLYFPVGVYRVDNIMLKSNMNVKGDGKGSVIKLNDNAPLTNVEEFDDYWNNCFTIYQISNVTIEDISLDGNKENNSATGAATDYRLNGVIIQESTDIILNRIYAYNNGYHGCIMSDDVYRVEISDSEFYNNGFRPFHGHGTIVDCKFVNNRCVNNGLGVNGDTTTGFDGIFFFDDCQRLLIDGNYVETNTNAGVDLGGSVLGSGSDTGEYKGSSNIIVSNNIIKKTDTSTKTPAGIQLIPALLDKVTIEGNTIMDCRFGIRGQESSYSPLGSYINICNNVFRTTYGIHCPVALKYANISNNQFVTCPEGGIILAGATDTQIIGNMFETIGAWTSTMDKDGIVLNNCKRTVISSNRFYNKSSGHWAQYGIKEKGATDVTLVSSNIFQDMAIAPYLFVGAGSKAVNNMINGVMESEVETALAEAKANGEFDGVGIASVKQTTTSSADNGVNVITVTLTDGTTSAFEVRNGSKGSTGASGGSTSAIEILSKSGGYWNIQGKWDDIDTIASKYTDAIPVTEGQKYTYTGYGMHQGASILWYSSYTSDEVFTLLSYEQYNDGGSTGNAQTAVVTVPTGAKYARFCSYSYGTPVLSVSAYEEQSATSVLAGKKIVYDGDSICESRLSGAESNGGAYAKLIADKTGSTYTNLAVSGARLTTRTDGGHSVVDNLANLPTDGDLYCFEGGINDYWNLDVPLGTWDTHNLDGVLDTTTVCGALETIFRHALNNFVGKPICFVITHKIQTTAFYENDKGTTFEAYHDAMVGICKKYSIPYYDAFSESGLNGWNDTQNNAYLTANSNGTPDGTHPNEEGYKRYYVPQLISLFERIMPRE